MIGGKEAPALGDSSKGCAIMCGKKSFQGNAGRFLFGVPETISVSAEMHANWMLDPEAVVGKARSQSFFRKRVGNLFFSCFLGTKPWGE